MLRPLASVPTWILGLGVLAGLLDGLVWPGAMLALFRPQLAVGLVAAAALAVLARSWRTAAAGLAAALLAAGLVAPAARVAPPQEPLPGQATARLLVVNLSNRNDDAAVVAALIRRERPDAIVLVEYTPRWREALRSALTPYPAGAAVVREGAGGIALVGREGRVAAAPESLARDAYPAVAGSLTVQGARPISLLAVHPQFPVLPHDHTAHDALLRAAGTWAATSGPRSAVCGDMNATPWTHALRRLLRDGGLRPALPHVVAGGSWPGLLPGPLRLPLDGCLTGAGVRARASLLPAIGSDHRPVLVELR